MSLLTKLVLLPTALATSPLLLAAGQLPTLDAVTLACELGVADDEELSDRILHGAATNERNSYFGYIVQPISTSQGAIVTSEQEWQAVEDAALTPDSTGIQDHCANKEEPSADTTEEATDIPAGELPDLSPEAETQPVPPSDLPSADSESEGESEGESESELEPVEPDVSESEANEPDASEPAHSVQEQPSPLIERPTAPPPSDPGRDPSNFTPEDPAPTPFDGIVEPTLESLPDGSYRYLSGNYEYGVYTEEQLIANGGSVFLLTKTGNQITGNLLPRLDLPGICVTGTVSGDTVSGAAYPHEATVSTTDSEADSGVTDTEPTNSEVTESEIIDAETVDAETTDAENKESAREIGDTFEPYGSGALQIRQSRIVDGQIYYEEAMLDLSNFSRINAGSSLSPTECDRPTSASNR